MSELKDVIPKGFYHGDSPRINAYTVGELKDAINHLPDDLPIAQGFGEGACLIVYNVSHKGGAHLSFEETED